MTERIPQSMPLTYSVCNPRRHSWPTRLSLNSGPQANIIFSTRTTLPLRISGKPTFGVPHTECAQTHASYCVFSLPLPRFVFKSSVNPCMDLPGSIVYSRSSREVTPSSVPTRPHLAITTCTNGSCALGIHCLVYLLQHHDSKFDTGLFNGYTVEPTGVLSIPA